MENKTPFGFHYSGNSVSIKLRFTGKKFYQSGIEKFGRHRPTTSGYVLFEATLDTRSPEFVELSSKIKQMQASN